jgi:hypothetical protein
VSKNYLIQAGNNEGNNSPGEKALRKKINDNFYDVVSVDENK